MHLFTQKSDAFIHSIIKIIALILLTNPNTHNFISSGSAIIMKQDRKSDNNIIMLNLYK